MTGLTQNIITAGTVAAALITLFGIIKSVIKYICSINEKSRIQQERNAVQDKDISHLKEENRLICYGLSAALDGLEQLGANHSVPTAKTKLEKYLNEHAHK